jgi:hypothetical protein
MQDIQATQRAFDGLSRIGVFLSIDDFGTGYSSLSYLRQLPARQLKIDRSFIKDLETSGDASAVVDAVIKLAHALSLSVVAEGVETQGQCEILLDLGCDELQGYFFARPMPAADLLGPAAPGGARRCAHAWMRGANANSSVANAINPGTGSTKSRAGSTSNSSAPSSPPAVAAVQRHSRRASSAGSFRRSAQAAMRCPGKIATAFDALAITGGRPAASIAGKVISVAPPATAFTMPPTKPAPTSRALVHPSMPTLQGSCRWRRTLGRRSARVWNECDQPICLR